MAANVPSPKKTTRLNGQAIERRACWIVERWNERPSLTYASMMAEVRRHFECGKTAAEQSIKRANEMLAEHVEKVVTRDRVAAKMVSLAESAERKGDERAAIRAWDSLARIRGMQAPLQVEHSGAIDNPSALNVADLTTAQLEALAALEGE